MGNDYIPDVTVVVRVNHTMLKHQLSHCAKLGTPDFRGKLCSDMERLPKVGVALDTGEVGWRWGRLVYQGSALSSFLLLW